MRPPGWLGARAAVDGLVCLAVAVLMLRCFEVEGYMISTGSMAPALYGYHKRVVCPSCETLFARGVAFDGSAALADEDDPDSGGHVVCPNCGQGAIDAGEIPRNHGDQLLVFKPAFELRPPRRWEVVVFRNPDKPTQAFVKRAVGLPGERVRVKEGDVYADGAICRKPLETQRAMRIPVFDAANEPTDADWRPRWHADAGWTDRGGGAFAFAPASEPTERPRDGNPSASAAWSYLTYHHRLRSGGGHETTVRLDPVPEDYEPSDSPFIEPVRFEPDPSDPAAGALVATGVLSGEWERRLLEASAAPAYRAAVADLAARSRFAPIADGYGYNRSLGLTPHAVRDLMVSFRLRLAGRGTFAVDMTDGREAFRLLFDADAATVSLLRIGTGETLRSAPLPEPLRAEGGGLVEFSLIDRQALAAVDGTEPFAPWTYDEPPRAAPPTPHPVRLGALGAIGASATVEDLVLYRDVYYTPGKGRHGVESDYALARDEYFVLGDNSPVSLDSRSWADAAVPAKMLLGKPFVVHLPSRPGTLRLGGRRLTVRIPDFARMRYIR